MQREQHSCSASVRHTMRQHAQRHKRSSAAHSVEQDLLHCSLYLINSTQAYSQSRKSLSAVRKLSAQSCLDCIEVASLCLHTSTLVKCARVSNGVCLITEPQKPISKAMSFGPKPLGYQAAMDEAIIAIEQVVIPRNQPIELLPRPAEILEMQVSMDKSASVILQCALTEANSDNSSVQA